MHGKCVPNCIPLYYDETASELIDKIDYDFSDVAEKSKSLMQRFGFLEVAMRQNDLAWDSVLFKRTPERCGCKLRLRT